MYDQKKPPTSERNLPILGRPGIEPLLDSNKAAAMLDVHPRTLQRMVLRGEIAGVQVGRSVSTTLRQVAREFSV